MKSLLMAAAMAACSLDLSVNAANVSDDDEDEDGDGGDDGAGDTQPEPAPKSTKKTKKVKKVKKGAKKTVSAKKSSKSDDKNRVRLKDLAKTAKITEAVARKKLRDADVERGEGRWSWELGSKGLKQARKALGLDK